MSTKLFINNQSCYTAYSKAFHTKHREFTIKYSSTFSVELTHSRQSLNSLECFLSRSPQAHTRAIVVIYFSFRKHRPLLPQFLLSNVLLSLHRPTQRTQTFLGSRWSLRKWRSALSFTIRTRIFISDFNGVCTEPYYSTPHVAPNSCKNPF